MQGDPSTRDRKRYCNYHRDKGHLTEECRALKRHLEDLVAAGHLKEFVDQLGSRPPRADSPDQDNTDAVGAILTIYSVMGLEHRERVKSWINEVQECKEDMTITPPPKRAKSDGRTTTISFSDDDLIGVDFPHDDPLILTLRIKGFDVHHLLVDGGSSSDILYYTTFKKLGLAAEDLVPMTTALYGFNSRPERPLGTVTLPVRSGTVTVPIEFVVIDSPSPYNVIMGRTWITKLGAVPSTYHQKIKFPTR